MFTSNLIKRAWKIRRESSVKFSCKIMEISWRECLIMAKEEKKEITSEGLLFFVSHHENLINKILSKPLHSSEKRMITRSNQVKTYREMIEIATSQDMPHNNDKKVCYSMINSKICRILSERQ